MVVVVVVGEKLMVKVEEGIDLGTLLKGRGRESSLCKSLRWGEGEIVVAWRRNGLRRR